MRENNFYLEQTPDTVSNTRNFCVRLFSIMITVFLLLCTLAGNTVSAADSGSNHTIKVGFFSFPGYHEIEKNSVRRGYGVDFLLLMQRYSDLNYEYVGYDRSWEDMLQMLRDGEIDMVTSARKTPEREKEFDFSEPIGSASVHLNVLTDNNDYKPGDFSSFDGMRIGLLAGSSRNADVTDYAHENGFTYKATIYQTVEELVHALNSHKVDAIATSSIRKITGEKTIAEFAENNFYAIVRKGDTDLLNEINYAIKEMDTNEGDWRNELYYKNYSDDNTTSLVFTQREKDYIAAVQTGKKEITVAAQPDRDPYSYVENGQLTGIIPDYFSYLMQMADLPYTELVAKDREEYEKWTLSGYATAFIDCRYDRAPELKADAFGPTTDSYMQITLSKVTRKGFSGKIHSIATVDTQGISGIEDNIAEDAQYVIVDSRQDAMQAVKDGKADACYVYTYMAEKFINSDLDGTLNHSIMNSPVYDEYIVINADSDHELISILNKCIRATNIHKMDELVTQYTSYSLKNLTPLQYLMTHPAVAISVALIVFASIVILILIIKNSQKAHAANKAKTTFLFNMSHDIRTPMNAIIGFTDLAAQNPGNPEKTIYYLDKIRKSSDNLLNLLDDVLEMSRIESGKISVSEDILNVGELQDAAAVVFENAMAQKHLTFHTELHIEHHWVYTDMAKIHRIFTNILSNAVKYTPAGGEITFSVTEIPCNKPGYCRFEGIVTDNGIGISKEFLPHIFEMFERERTATDSGIEGTGLGLASVKKNVDLLGGEIRVESERGKGSRFIVRLEHRIAKPSSRSACEIPDNTSTALDHIFKGKRVLLAEDNELNTEIATTLLTSHGFLVEHAADGQICVDMLQHSTPGYYTVVLMDVQMPNLNGYAATQKIRKLSDPGLAHIPVIAVTANAFEEDRKRALDAGMDGFVSKPINASEIIEVLHSILQNKKEHKS